jgi:WW domain-binding protein 2
MALDWTMLDARHQFIPLHDETTIMSIDRDSQVEISLTIPPSGTATTGGNGVVKKMKEKGRLWLTNKRVRLSLHIKVWV